MPAVEDIESSPPVRDSRCSARICCDRTTRRRSTSGRPTSPPTRRQRRA